MVLKVFGVFTLLATLAAAAWAGEVWKVTTASDQATMSPDASP